MNVHDAMKKATPGPLYVAERGEQGPYLRSMSGGLVAEARDTEDAALLAHWYNHGPELLDFVTRLGECKSSDETHDLIVNHAGELIEDASEVEGI